MEYGISLLIQLEGITNGVFIKKNIVAMHNCERHRSLLKLHDIATKNQMWKKYGKKRKSLKLSFVWIWESGVCIETFLLKLLKKAEYSIYKSFWDHSLNTKP